jgi:hypothetical protein
MRIKIGRHFWELVIARELPGNDGETRIHEGTLVPRQIVLRDGDTDMRWTLLHELFHCASEDENLGLTERQVRGLEKWFKKLERHRSLSSLLDAYTPLKSTTKPIKKCT